MTARITCCVPFCRRTCRNEKGWQEWICQKHWSQVPKRLRRVHTRILRLERMGQPVPALRAGRIWARVKRAAVEAAAGI